MSDDDEFFDTPLLEGEKWKVACEMAADAGITELEKLSSPARRWRKARHVLKAQRAWSEMSVKALGDSSLEFSRQEVEANPPANARKVPACASCHWGVVDGQPSCDRCGTPTSDTYSMPASSDPAAAGPRAARSDSASAARAMPPPPTLG